MKYATVCSGIEAPSVAAEPLGWIPVWFSEIEPFPCKVLAHHYPDVPNLGDMTKITKERIDELGPVDVFVGGTPCQSFSIAGLRQGLADPRGNLALEYLRIADALRPRFVVWENVPGVLSSNGGRDFESFLTALAELGYGWAYRVLDAQFFGVAQRRRRVFVVGCAGGDWKRAAEILFEPESVRGDSAPSREAGEGITRTVAPCLEALDGNNWGCNQWVDSGKAVIERAYRQNTRDESALTNTTPRPRATSPLASPSVASPPPNANDSKDSPTATR
jgi:DNA (cytosine-5)-methyltransferase 1